MRDQDSVAVLLADARLLISASRQNAYATGWKSTVKHDDVLERIDAALQSQQDGAQGGEAVGYANPEEYATFASGEDHTFVVYRHGVHAKDVALYSRPAIAPQSTPAADVDLCEVARELERVHVQRVIGEVEAMAENRTDAHWSGFSLACDEIAHRLGLTAALAAPPAEVKP